MKTSRPLALMAATGAATIYGLNHSIAKGLMPQYIEPYGFILLRVLGALLLFWFFGLFAPKERIASSDWARIIGCSIFGMVINMLMFFKGLSLSTPINSSVIITISPIMVLILSAFFIGERITWLKVIGIVLGFMGALGLILYGEEMREDAPNIPLGNTLFLINATSYSIYLVMIKPLTAKYHSFTLMKWLFLFSLLINLPIGWAEFTKVSWGGLPLDVVLKMAFVVIGTTFLTYLLNIYALKTLKASTIGVFIYLQPLLAIFFSILMNADKLSPVKVSASLLVFSGVYLVTRSSTKKT